MGTLYVVATPIGNLEDVTLRALRILREADAVLAEDTRRTRILLEAHRISGRPRSLHAHNEKTRTDEVLELLEGDGRVALVSDAGTPLISDPGERLVEAVLAAGHDVVPIPGPSAPIAALVGSGLSSSPFTFVGFLPRRAGERRRLLESLRHRPETLVFFESPRRLRSTLAELQKHLGDRRACVARELTKLHEQWIRGTLVELEARLDEDVRGEVTLVVAGADTPPPLGAPELDEEVRARLAAGEKATAIAAALAPRAGMSRREIYAMVLRLRGRK